MTSPARGSGFAGSVRCFRAFVTLLVTAAAGLFAEAPASEVGARGPYLGQEPPGREPTLFAPGVVSTPESDELNAVFSPDGEEFLFARRVGEALKVFSSRQGSDGRWSRPRMVDFSRANDRWDEVDMWFSIDGQWLYYISNAPVPAFAEGSVNIWRVARSGDGWGTPQVLPPPLNSDGTELYPMPVASGHLYFSSTREGGFGSRDIYRARAEGDSFEEVVNLGPEINSAAREGDLYVAPDESYLIVTSNRPGGHGKADLYISRRRADGSWGPLRNLGEPVNSEHADYCPVVSRDGRYFFFTRGGDVYWVEARFLKSASDTTP